MNIELKRCPFCGGTETHIADDLVVFWGACLNCGATSSVSSYESGAAEEWNRRAELADARAEIARLRGALEAEYRRGYEQRDAEVRGALL